MALGYLGLRPSSDVIRYSLAGQPPPLLRRASGSVEELELPEHRLPLGALRMGGYRVLKTVLDVNDLLLAYSDGVVDAQSPDGEPFGEARLHRVLTDGPAEPEAALKAILGEL